jgi:O-antigen/teichoic acid export membrane protein
VKKDYSKSLLYRSAIAAIDQAFLSGLNFLISLVLIKIVSKTEYGYYSLFFPITLYIVSIQNAIINTPLAVLLISKKGDEKRSYAGALFFGQYIFVIPLAVVGIIGGIITYNMNLVESGESAIIVAISLATIGILCREFLRAYFFANEKPNTVLIIDVLYFFLITVLGLLANIFFQLDVAVIFFLMGLSSFLIGIFFINRNNWKFSRCEIKSSYSENWQYGKWSLIGVTISHIQSYSYLYLLGIMVSSAAVADVSAARLLLMPLVLAQQGWSKVILPHGSKLREENRFPRLFKEQVIISVIFVLIVISLVFAIILLKPILLKTILSPEYENSFNYVYFWGVIFSLGFIALNASFGLQVLKKFDVISKINFLAMLVTVLLSYFLIHSNGIKGGLTALLIGQLISAVLLWIIFYKISFLS